MDNPDETNKYLAEMVDLLKENQKKIEAGQTNQTTILAEIKEEQKIQFNNLKEGLSKESRKIFEIFKTYMELKANMRIEQVQAESSNYIFSSFAGATSVLIIFLNIVELGFFDFLNTFVEMTQTNMIRFKFTSIFFGIISWIGYLLRLIRHLKKMQTKNIYEIMSEMKLLMTHLTKTINDKR